MSFFKEFQTFISKGNVMDMAVGVIVGGAFNQIIGSLVKDIFNRFSLSCREARFTNLFWVLKLLKITPARIHTTPLPRLAPPFSVTALSSPR